MQLKNQQEFNDYIDNIINSNDFNSTYKLALLIAIAKICQNKSIDYSDTIFIDYQEICEYFIKIYWYCTEFYPNKDNELILLRHGKNSGKDKIIFCLQEMKNLANFQNVDDIDTKNKYYIQESKEICKIIKQNPVKFLQNINEKVLFDEVNNVKGIESNSGIAYFFKHNSNNIINQAKIKFISVILTNPKNNLDTSKFNQLMNFIFRDNI